MCPFITPDTLDIDYKKINNLGKFKMISFLNLFFHIEGKTKCFDSHYISLNFLDHFF